MLGVATSARCLGLKLIALQGSEVVRIAELRAPLFEDRPVTLLTLGPERLRQLAFEIRHDAVVIEQGVIDIEQKDDRGRLRHRVASLGRGLCQPPSAAMRAPASFGPQLPCR